MLMTQKTMKNPSQKLTKLFKRHQMERRGKNTRMAVMPVLAAYLPLTGPAEQGR